MVRVLRVRRGFVSPAASDATRQAWRIWVWFANHVGPQGVTPGHGQVSLFASLYLPSILSPTTPCRPDALSGVFRPSGLPSDAFYGRAVPFRVMRLGFRHSLAGSPRQQAESS